MYKLCVVLILCTCFKLAENKPNDEKGKNADRDKPEKSSKCVLPPYPAHGSYEVEHDYKAVPGQILRSALITFKCAEGYKLNMNSARRFCIEGSWSDKFPLCFANASTVIAASTNSTEELKSCPLNRLPGVAYQCFTVLQRGFVSRRIRKLCDDEVTSGTYVITFCQEQEFDDSPESLCTNGMWNFEPTCAPSATPDPKLVETFDPTQSADCLLPPYPVHGSYKIINNNFAVPGETINIAVLNYTCYNNYVLNTEKNQLFCIEGSWSGKFPKCVVSCRLIKHPSVKYNCRISESEDYRECNEYEPIETVIKPECKIHYYYPSVLPLMRCKDDGWDTDPTCLADCGRLIPKGSELISSGRIAEKGELPWQVAIYRTTSNSYMQICGGSLVSTSVIISAAHCFWTSVDKQLPASDFSVAVGKLYQSWDHPDDVDVQKSEVSKIIIPPRFQGASTGFQDDIALMVVKTPFEYNINVRPVCLDFDYNFDRQQLNSGKLGKVAGWGLTGPQGDASPILLVVNLPYVDIGVCISQSPRDFRQFITSDKICAGYANGTAICKGDSGGGLSFPDVNKGVERYYLRGIVSTSPMTDDVVKCNTLALTTFTHVIIHEHFIKEIVKID